ncbi:MAG: hypothetical protein V3V08_06905 [Nannocystaceae bacterium]
MSVRSYLVIFVSTSGLACGQVDPPDPATSSAGGSTGDSVELKSLYPLVPGSSWVYRHTNATGNVTGLEFVNLSATMWTDFQGNQREAFLLADEEDGAGRASRSYIIRDGSAALRVHKEVATKGVVELEVDYNPGFLRADDAWKSGPGPAVGWSYTRTAIGTALEGEQPDVDERSHDYKVIAVDVEITVDAGTFNCVHVRRTRTSGNQEGEVVNYWFAPGVGKVKEHRDNSVDGVSEELLDAVMVPGVR